MEKMKEIRKAKKITMQELADKVGINVVSVFRYEHGERKPDIETAVKIADALGVSIDCLLGIK